MVAKIRPVRVTRGGWCCAHLTRRSYKACAVARFRNQFARGQKTIGSHLNWSLVFLWSKMICFIWFCFTGGLYVLEMLSPILENLTKEMNRETVEQRRKLHCNTVSRVIWLTLIKLLVSSSQERVGFMLPWYLHLLWFYPTCFQPKFPWSEKKICALPLITKNICHCSPYLFPCFIFCD